MSFVSYKDTIEDGDTVIIYLSISSLYALSLSAGKVYQTKYGALKHDDIIGKKYGEVVNCSKGWAYVLHPTPELWTLTLPHRTQILYSADISVIIFQLELKPGSIVCESGTGSGSISHAILRTVAPNGHLHTFDFHEQRVETVKKEFEDHGVADLVTVKHRDVVTDGFGLDGVADAVFLDLPLPWNVVPSAVAALKREGGRLCSFSPCIEQVQKTCAALSANGFIDVITMECLQITKEVRTISMPTIDLNVNEDSTETQVQRSEDSAEISASLPEDDSPFDGDPSPPSSSKDDGAPRRKRPRRSQQKQLPRGSQVTFRTSIPPLQMTGHTGYLTFATLLPR